jgi:hypothetical protein
VPCGIYVRGDQGLCRLSNVAGPGQEYRGALQCCVLPVLSSFHLCSPSSLPAVLWARVSEVAHTALPPSPRQRFLWLPQVPLHRHRSSRPRLMAHGIWWHGHRRGLGYLIRRRDWRISAGRRHIGCVDVVYVRERGILGAAGGGEGGLLPAWVLLAWRGWVVYPRQQKYGGSS